MTETKTGSKTQTRIQNSGKSKPVGSGLALLGVLLGVGALALIPSEAEKEEPEPKVFSFRDLVIQDCEKNGYTSYLLLEDGDDFLVVYPQESSEDLYLIRRYKKKLSLYIPVSSPVGYFKIEKTQTKDEYLIRWSTKGIEDSVLWDTTETHCNFRTVDISIFYLKDKELNPSVWIQILNWYKITRLSNS